MTPWSAPDKALLLVSRTTRLSYAEPVVEAHSELRQVPVDTGLQRVVTHKLEVDPVATVRAHRDYYGNDVRHFDLLEPHDGVAIRVECVVETTDAAGCGRTDGSDPRPWRQRLAEFLSASPCVPALDAHARIPSRVRPDLAADAFVDALRELAATFRTRFRCDPVVGDVAAHARSLFESGGGSRRDLAHGMLGVLRRGGVPCRFASGYLHEEPDEPRRDRAAPGADADHAWVEASHEAAGWIGADPANGRLVDWRYVRAAVGRDHGDAPPLRGVFVGPAAQRLDVEIEVRRIG